MEGEVRGKNRKHESVIFTEDRVDDIKNFALVSERAGGGDSGL